MQSTSNKQNSKPKWLGIIAIFFCLTALLGLTQPIVAYAEDNVVLGTPKPNAHSGSGTISADNYWGDLNGAERENGETQEVSYLYWAGSIYRTGYLFYIIDKETGHILTPQEFGLSIYSGPMGVLIFKDRQIDVNVPNSSSHRVFETHFGAVRSTGIVRDPDLTLPITYIKTSPTTGVWDGNSEDVEDYLFKEVVDTDGVVRHWWMILYRDGLINLFSQIGYGTDAASRADIVLKKLVQNQSKYALVMETVSSQAAYDGTSWGGSGDISDYTLETIKIEDGSDADEEPDEVQAYHFTQDDELADSEYYFYSWSLKPKLDRDGSVFKVISTAMHGAKLNTEITGSDYIGAKTWLCEALPYSMTLDEPFLSISAQNEDSDPLPVSTISDKNRGYGMMVIEIDLPQISTYDGSSTTPAKAEDPNPDKTGECEIIKVYGKKTIKSDGTTVTENIGVYKQPNTTNSIFIDKQKDGKYKCTSCGATSKIKRTLSHYYSHHGSKEAADAFIKLQCNLTPHTHQNWTSKGNPGCWETKKNTETTYNTTCSAGKPLPHAAHTHQPYVNASNKGCYTRTEYCRINGADPYISLGIKNVFQGNYSSIVVPALTHGVSFDGNCITEPASGEVINSVKIYSTLYHTRVDSKLSVDDEASKKFNFALILLRGDDPVTLVKWKDGAYKDSITGMTDKFSVADTLSGDRKYGDYSTSFGVKFEDNSTDLSTKVSFTKTGVWDYEWKGSKQTYTGCPENTKSYVLDASHTISDINVLVNVFSAADSDVSSAVSGSTTVSFYPYVRMYYDTLTSKNNEAFVLGTEGRTFQVHDGAELITPKRCYFFAFFR